MTTERERAGDDFEIRRGQRALRMTTWFAAFLLGVLTAATITGIAVLLLASQPGKGPTLGRFWLGALLIGTASAWAMALAALLVSLANGRSR